MKAGWKMSKQFWKEYGNNNTEQQQQQQQQQQ